MGVFVGGGGGGGGGVDLDLDFKNFWDGVYNFFFCPPLGLTYNFHDTSSIDVIQSAEQLLLVNYLLYEHVLM